MAVYKIFPLQDATLYSKYSVTNTGRDEVLEIGSRNNPSLADLPVVTTTGLGSDDIRRTVISFSSSDLTAVAALTTGSYKTYLRMFLADAKELSSDYTVEFYPVAQQWSVGTGRLADVPTVSDGVSWTFAGQSGSSAVWNFNTNSGSYLYTTGGGSLERCVQSIPKF